MQCMQAEIDRTLIPLGLSTHGVVCMRQCSSNSGAVDLFSVSTPLYVENSSNKPQAAVSAWKAELRPLSLGVLISLTAERLSYTFNSVFYNKYLFSVFKN